MNWLSRLLKHRLTWNLKNGENVADVKLFLNGIEIPVESFAMSGETTINRFPIDPSLLMRGRSKIKFELDFHSFSTKELKLILYPFAYIHQKCNRVAFYSDKRFDLTHEPLNADNVIFENGEHPTPLAIIRCGHCGEIMLEAPVIRD